MEKLRTAIIGAGKMGNIHAKVYSQLPMSELVGVADKDAKRAEKIAKKYKAQAYTDYNDLIGKVDAVILGVAHRGSHPVGREHPPVRRFADSLALGSGERTGQAGGQGQGHQPASLYPQTRQESVGREDEIPGADDAAR